MENNEQKSFPFANQDLVGREPTPERLSTFDERLGLFLHNVQHNNITFIEKLRHLGQLAESPADMECLLDKLRRV